MKTQTQEETLKEPTALEPGIKRRGNTFIAIPPSAERYLERVINLQRDKIDRQQKELARMNSVYQRNVRTTKISEAVKFLISVIANKIKI